MSKNQNTLVIAIVFASTILAGSLIFFAMQLSSNGGFSEAEISQRVQDGIEDYQFNEAYPLVPGGANEDDDPVMGDPNAPVTIVEFTDYECPYCARFTLDTLPLLKSKYIDTGKAKLVLRDFPLSFHPNADDAAIAAECARAQSDDEVYFEFHDKIFEGGALSNARYIQYATDLNLDIDKFNTCLNDPKMAEEVQSDLVEGAGYGINGTPGFVINGRRISGAQDVSVFEYIIDKALSEI
jgi:protein-disulfide isomerase